MASVESEWCKKELSAGLLRELEERRVVVLPVLAEHCEIPLFLREKVYADFRTDYDTGLNTILEAVARVTSDTQGRLDRPEWHVDWAVDWDILDETLVLRITAVEQAQDKPYCVLSEMKIVGNEVATARYLAFLENELDWIERLAIIDMIATSMREGALALQFVIDDQNAKVRTREVEDPTLGARYQISISVRRIGEDNGKDVFIDYGEQFKGIARQLRDTLREPSQQEETAIKKFTTKYRGCAGQFT
jgi:TIR domain-containing protein